MEVDVQVSTGRGILILVVLFFVIMGLRFIGIERFFSLEYLQQKAFFLRTFVDAHYVLALMIYTFVFAVTLACAVPVTGPLTLVGGFLFGTMPGMIVATIGMTCGATISFLLIRYVSTNTVVKRFSEKRDRFAKKVKQYGSTYILTLNLLTVVPFFVISTLAAITNVSVWTFIWTSAVGSLPMVAIYAFAGQKFANITSFRDIVSPSLIGACILLALLSIIPMIIKRMKYVSEV